MNQYKRFLNFVKSQTLIHIFENSPRYATFWVVQCTMVVLSLISFFVYCFNNHDKDVFLGFRGDFIIGFTFHSFFLYFSIKLFKQYLDSAATTLSKLLYIIVFALALGLMIIGYFPNFEPLGVEFYLQSMTALIMLGLIYYMFRGCSILFKWLERLGDLRNGRLSYEEFQLLRRMCDENFVWTLAPAAIQNPEPHYVNLLNIHLLIHQRNSEPICEWIKHFTKDPAKSDQILQVAKKLENYTIEHEFGVVKVNGKIVSDAELGHLVRRILQESISQDPDNFKEFFKFE